MCSAFSLIEIDRENFPEGRRIDSTRLEPAAHTAPGARATDPLHRSSRPEDLLGLSMLCVPRNHYKKPLEECVKAARPLLDINNGCRADRTTNESVAAAFRSEISWRSMRWMLLRCILSF